MTVDAKESPTENPVEDFVFTSSDDDFFLLHGEDFTLTDHSGSEISIRVQALKQFLFEARRKKISALADILYP